MASGKTGFRAWRKTVLLDFDEVLCSGCFFTLSVLGPGAWRFWHYEYVRSGKDPV
jgi:hypothetical protein